MTILAALVLLVTEVHPATIPDPGFDRGLDHWSMTGHRGYRAEPGSNYPARPRRRWLQMGWAARSRAPDDAAYRVVTFVDARRYRNRLVRFSAAVRTRGRGGRLVVAANGATAFVELLPGEGWGRQDVTLRIPSGADRIEVGFHLRRGGALDADDVRLDILR